MDQPQQEQYVAALRAKERELLAGLHNREGLAAESAPDVFDEIQLALDRALVVRALDHSSGVLRQVREALARIEAGVYGYCQECEQEINPKRLAAIPWARFCLLCQVEADRHETSDCTGAKVEITAKAGAYGSEGLKSLERTSVRPGAK